MQTAIEFTLPVGYADDTGMLHRDGRMRLATARDEIQPLADPQVRSNEAYLTILLLARTVERIGPTTTVTPDVIEGLFAADFDHLPAPVRADQQPGGRARASRVPWLPRADRRRSGGHTGRSVHGMTAGQDPGAAGPRWPASVGVGLDAAEFAARMIEARRPKRLAASTRLLRRGMRAPAWAEVDRPPAPVVDCSRDAVARVTRSGSLWRALTRRLCRRPAPAPVRRHRHRHRRPRTGACSCIWSARRRPGGAGGAGRRATIVAGNQPGGERLADGRPASGRARSVSRHAELSGRGCAGRAAARREPQPRRQRVACRRRAAGGPGAAAGG